MKRKISDITDEETIIKNHKIIDKTNNKIYYTPEGELFFKMEESIEMLCLYNPEPKLIATLLQLSRHVRLLIWRFLTDKDKCERRWVKLFLTKLWEYRENRPRHKEWVYNNLDPVFVGPGKKLQREQYYIGKMMISNSDSRDVLKGGYFTYIEGGELAYPSFEMEFNVEPSHFFYWHIVAKAMVLRFDAMILYNEIHRVKDEFMSESDKLLCLL